MQRQPRSTRRRTSLLALALASALGGCSSEVTIATFNIRFFPEEGTDRSKVAAEIAALDASIIAVQEIRDVRALGDVLEDVSTRTGRDYQVIIGTCGGDGQGITTGIVYDAEAWTVAEHRDYPDLRPDGECGQRRQPGTLGVFEDSRGQRLSVLSVHLRPFPHEFDVRREQWGRLLQRLDEIEQRHDAPAVALGDYNSTGYRDEPKEERTFIDTTVAQAGYQLPTAGLACTEYWRPKGDEGPFRPSMLDHVVATRGRWTPAKVRGMCERLACAPTKPEAMDPDYASVSDHCPVTVSTRL